MKITIRYHAQARQAVGIASEVFAAVGPVTIQALIIGLAERHGDRLRAMVLTDAALPHPSLLLFVGEEQVRSDSTRPLCDGAEVMLFSPIAGG